MELEQTDVALDIYDAVSNTLTLSGLRRETAQKYAYFAVELYDYVKERPQLQTALQGTKSIYRMGRGAKGWAAAAHLEGNATAMNAFTAAEKFAAKGNVFAGGAISAFVDYFAVVAKNLGIEMNECAISITKVMLDVLTTIALADTLVGVWAAALQLLSLGSDLQEMQKACFAAG